MIRQPSPLRGAASIVGVGETAMTSGGGPPLLNLVIEACLAALDDAGLTTEDVDGIITDNEFSAIGVSGNELIGALGMEPTFMIQAPSAGAGYAYAPLLAAMAIEAGEANVVLSFVSLDWGGAKPGVSDLFYVGESAERDAFEFPFGFVGTPLFYASAAQRYRALHGLEDEQLGEIAVAIRNHGARHPRAQRPVAVTMDDYLASPYLAEPLRLLDTCLRTTGAAAFVVTGSDRAQSLTRPPVYALGAGFAADATSRRHYWTQRKDYPWSGTGVAASRAFAMSGLTPADVDVAEIQDPYTIAVLLQIEGCGFCQQGEGAAFVENGRISVGGELPVNTHGGQLSHGYMASVTHLIEAVRQLRGDAPANQIDGAGVALVSGLGPGDAGVLILGRDR